MAGDAADAGAVGGDWWVTGEDGRRRARVGVTFSLRMVTGIFPAGGTYNFGKIFSSMRKLAVLFFIGFIMGGRSEAQSLKGTAWKFYVESLHDTLTMHVGADSSYTTSSSGELIVKSVSKLQNDTLRMRDVGGEYYCLDGEGVYRITVEGDYLTFFLITDPCNNRSEALNGTKFRKTESK